MNTDLLLKAADLIEKQVHGPWNNVSYDRDTAAYILYAAGQNPTGTRWPVFEQAINLAKLPDDTLLWSGGWPAEWKEAIWDATLDGAGNVLDKNLLAESVAEMIRYYAENGGW